MKMLSSAKISNYLNTGLPIHLTSFEEISSTNEMLFRDAQTKKIPDFSVYVAERQNAGRGRLNRKWESPAGSGLWFSILLRPKINYHYTNLINLYTAYALAAFLEREVCTVLGLPIVIDLKWPNDLYIRGQKVAGILLKSNFNGPQFDFMVVGIGLNVNQRMADFSSEIRQKATSLLLATGREWDREKLFGRFLNFYFENYQHFFPANFSQIPDLYQQKMSFSAQPIRIRTGNEELTGKIESISPEGYLILNCEKGKRTISTGDIFPSKMESADDLSR